MRGLSLPKPPSYRTTTMSLTSAWPPCALQATATPNTRACNITRPQLQVEVNTLLVNSSLPTFGKDAWSVFQWLLWSWSWLVCLSDNCNDLGSPLFLAERQLPWLPSAYRPHYMKVTISLENASYLALFCAASKVRGGSKNVICLLDPTGLLHHRGNCEHGDSGRVLSPPNHTWPLHRDFVGAGGIVHLNPHPMTFAFSSPHILRFNCHKSKKKK